MFAHSSDVRYHLCRQSLVSPETRPLLPIDGLHEKCGTRRMQGRAGRVTGSIGPGGSSGHPWEPPPPASSQTSFDERRERNAQRRQNPGWKAAGDFHQMFYGQVEQPETFRVQPYEVSGPEIFFERWHQFVEAFPSVGGMMKHPAGINSIENSFLKRWVEKISLNEKNVGGIAVRLGTKHALA